MIPKIPLSPPLVVPPRQQASPGTQPTTKAPGAAATGTPQSPSTVNISARLPTLIDLSTDSLTAAKAYKEAETLEPYAQGPKENIGLALVKANAQAMLGHDKQSCDIVETIKERGAATPWAEKISLLVKQCAQ